LYARVKFEGRADDGGTIAVLTCGIGEKVRYALKYFSESRSAKHVVLLIDRF